MKRISMIDVAKAANVSQATVSRALNTPSRVSKETLEKIINIIKETNYIYNSAAADFTRQKKTLIGLIVFTLKSSIQTGLIDGIQKEIEKTNYSLIIGNSHYDPATEHRLIQEFQERQLAGIIVAESTELNRDFLRSVHKAGIHVVLTWDKNEDPVLDSVGIDNYKASSDMTNYLIGLGHRRIGFIAGMYNKIERVRHRFEGYCDALKAADIPIDHKLIISTTPSALNGKIAMAQLLSHDPDLTAVFAASDALAFGALSAIRDKKLRVPEDISICGFDDAEFSSFCSPSLTTIHVPTEEMGRCAANVIVEKIRTGKENQLKITLDTNIIIRDSCGNPPHKK
ncbi:MAG: LacI family DNA-binding transcriptional regulator [Spirochaetales bacterium]|nr:LacI family DNA-binding transcriptional regulator [Spirochaetales bacterium]